MAENNWVIGVIPTYRGYFTSLVCGFPGAHLLWLCWDSLFLSAWYPNLNLYFPLESWEETQNEGSRKNPSHCRWPTPNKKSRDEVFFCLVGDLFFYRFYRCNSLSNPYLWNIFTCFNQLKLTTNLRLSEGGFEGFIHGPILHNIISVPESLPLKKAWFS